MLGERPNNTQLQRVEAVRPQRVQAMVTAPTRTWYRLDRNAKAFLTTKTSGPSWNKVPRRVTLNLSSGDILEDLRINKTTSEKLLHRMLPSGTTQTTRRRRSPRLDKLADAERPDAVGNVQHRIVALVAAEKAEIPRLVIKQHKLTRGYGAANLELQLREWGYEDHSDWAEVNNFAQAKH